MWKTGLLRPRRVLRLRSRFLIPVLIASLPLAVFAAVVVVLLWRHQQEELRQEQLNSARSLAVAVGGTLQSTRMHLEHMAASPLLAEDSMSAFRARCEDLLRIRKDWRHIVLIDRSGNRVFRTESGGPVDGTPAAMTPHLVTALRTRAPVVSDFFLTPEGETLVSLLVPVIEDGEVEYVLGAALELGWFDALLFTHVQDGIVSLFDSRHRLISRNVGADRYRGERAPGDLEQAMTAHSEGRLQTMTFDRLNVDAVWVPVPGADWKVMVGHHPTVLFARPFAHVTLLAVLGLLVLASGGVVAVRTSRSLQKGIEAAARRAGEVAEGKHVDVPPTGTVELDLLGQAHRQAAAKIRQAEKERDELLVREQDARAVAEQANRAKDEFLAMLGHELRNPIGAISNSAELLQMPRLTHEQQRFARETIARQTGHLARLIDDLLDVGRVVSGKVHLRPEPLDLAQCVRAGIATAKAAGHGADHVFALRCRRAIVCADRTRVEQVIANLIGNAIKYSPRGSKIVVETRVDGDEAVLSVADSGMGLTAEQMRSVFELFYQAPRGDNRIGGLGIGLTVVKRIVELHGGSVVVDSAGQGQGATFTVRLPLLKDRAAVVEAPPVCREPGRGMNVVLVEDNRDARESLGMLLTADGHAVYTAVDGIQGVNQILDIEPDAAIIDIDLPGIDGYEIARRVRAAGHGAMLLIAHSGYGQAEDVLRAQEAGFDAHLVKPVDMQKLRRLLASRGGGRSAAGEPAGVTRLFAIKPLAPSGGRPLAS